jgi:hypothetical protein
MTLIDGPAAEDPQGSGDAAGTVRAGAIGGDDPTPDGCDAVDRGIDDRVASVCPARDGH